MFQFPPYAFCNYFTCCRILQTSLQWVSPFGHFRIKECLASPRKVSSPTPSFIASQSQGILRLLVLCLRSLESLLSLTCICKRYYNEIVFQSSSIDVLPLKRTSTGFILSKNKETFVPKNTNKTLSLVGLARLELATSPLSGVCSNHLSYKP